MLTLEKYLELFSVKKEEFLTIAFDDENKIVLITRKDMERVKFEILEESEWKLIKTLLPVELSFVGFQHSLEGNSFSAYATI